MPAPKPNWDALQIAESYGMSASLRRQIASSQVVESRGEHHVTTPRTCSLSQRGRRANQILRLDCEPICSTLCVTVSFREHPEATGLVPVPRSGKPELLSLSDIAALSLTGLQHATLVACWDADNYVLPGRWTLVIAQAFHCCGTVSFAIFVAKPLPSCRSICQSFA